MRGVCCLITAHGQLRPDQSHSFPGGLELRAERAEAGAPLEGVDENGVCVYTLQEARGKEQLGLKFDPTSFSKLQSPYLFFSPILHSNLPGRPMSLAEVHSPDNQI